MTCLSLAAGLGIYYVQQNAGLPTNHPIPLIGYWVISAFMFPLCAILQYLSARRMQQALARAGESEERFRSISNVAFEGIMIQKGGVILDANRKFAEIFGYEDPEEIIGKNGLAFLLAPEFERKSTSRVDVGTRPDLRCVWSTQRRRHISRRNAVTRNKLSRDKGQCGNDARPH